MVDPNAMIEPAHRTYFIETRDDEPLTGLLQEETDQSLRLLQVGGSLEEVAWEQVREIRASNLSLMPEGLEGGLSPTRLADLLAYLRSLQ